MSAGISTGTSAGKAFSIYLEGAFLVHEKQFKTIAEQIELLKSRGLVINDEDATSKYLLHHNYYNIINGYSKYFPRRGETYTMGTSFDEVAQLYSFDSKLRHSLLDATITAESHLRSIFAYRFAEAYPDIPYAYLNTSCYDEKKTLKP